MSAKPQRDDSHRSESAAHKPEVQPAKQRRHYRADEKSDEAREIITDWASI